LETARALIDTADVLLENFRPGLMDSLGLGAAALSERNPRLIFVSHKGFLAGPYEHRTALDEVVQMMGGLAYMTGPEGRPLRAGTSVNDIMGGMFGAIGVLAALRERERTGRGQEVQSALFENCAFLSAQHVQQFLMTGAAPPPMPSRVSAWSVYDVFTLAGGEQLFVAATSDRQFQTLCGLIDRPDLASDPALATNAQRVAVRPQLLASLAQTMATLDKTDLAKRLEHAGLPYAPITRPDELVNDPHLTQSGGLVSMVTDDGDATQVILLPLTLGGRRLGVRKALPRIGEDTQEVLASLRTATRDAA
jgi:crotonobetainyl-CoA:carnitine CoA-transferase CaiB-like acyl-CoA transferase